VDERNRYLLEDYSITYLTSGRDLLRLQLSAGSRQGPLVVANPLFESGASAGVAGAPAQTSAQNRRSADFASSVFAPLPGTKGEATALGSILTGVRVFTDAQASESLLKHVGGPSILHIATHGFFLPDQPQGTADDVRATSRSSAQGVGGAGHVEGENPLLRSGLALAGANRGRGGEGEDGVLTALEAAGLDLWGTKLVVLSACETGVGEVRNGNGVYGLRRALVLAGAESQVMSLWQVSDDATRDLMIGYYKRLQAGEGRTEALRSVQLEMLRGGQQDQSSKDRGLSSKLGGQTKQSRSHPFFWASFIESGDWRSMNSQAVENK
jgi:CHAT domain-containing protein